jgi:hypothetical protein
MEAAKDQLVRSVSLANGRVLRVVADAPSSVRLEVDGEAETCGVTLTGRDIYYLSNALTDAFRDSRIRARRT